MWTSHLTLQQNQILIISMLSSMTWWSPSFKTKFCLADQTHKFMNIINDVRHGVITMFARDMESSRRAAGTRVPALWVMWEGAGWMMMREVWGLLLWFLWCNWRAHYMPCFVFHSLGGPFSRHSILGNAGPHFFFLFFWGPPPLIVPIRYEGKRKK
jgi:hypothetical protein